MRGPLPLMCISSTSCGVRRRKHAQFQHIHVYDCEGIMWFCHPSPSPSQLDDLYSQWGNWTSVPLGAKGLTRHRGSPERGRPSSREKPASQEGPSRSQHQYEYIKATGMESWLPSRAVVVEIGCNDASLLSLFAGPDRVLVCVQPSAMLAFRTAAADRLNQSSSTAWHIVNQLWSPTIMRDLFQRDVKINLFLSSHVLEHMPDMCDWASGLHHVMAQNGAVFTEVPNHTGAYIVNSKVAVWGMGHISFPSPLGMQRIMESAGFMLGQLSTFGYHTDAHSKHVAANGQQIRSLFFKGPPLPRFNCGMSGFGCN